jgi:hypothetical protein
MRKLIGLLVISAFFVFPLCVNAYIIGNVNLTENYSWPAATVSFDSGATSGGFYANYTVSLNGGAFSPAFCVENTNGPGSTLTPYTLLTIDAGLDSFGLTSLNYRAAAWVAQQNYLNNSVSAAAQVAIWEIIYDGINNFNLGAGTFRSYSSGYGNWNADALAIWNTIPINSLPAVSSEWVLAVNPTVVAGDTISETGTQNYIVHSQVPIPAAVWLLGTGLVGLVGIRRRFQQ